MVTIEEDEGIGDASIGMMEAYGAKDAQEVFY